MPACVSSRVCVRRGCHTGLAGVVGGAGVCASFFLGSDTSPGWAGVTDYAEIELEGTRLVLCHYPLRAWRGQGRGWWQLHGHSHGRLKPLTRQRDVGVDAHDFAPVRLAHLTARRRPAARGLRSGTRPQKKLTGKLRR